MKFWISKNSEVSIHEQIVTQIRVGVASRDLVAGEKLPSTREFARRFAIHPNTVSAAYRELANTNIVDFRKGSGVFVAGPESVPKKTISVEGLLADFVAEASSAGFSRTDIASAMTRWLTGKNERKLILVESDLGLRRILEEEILAGLGIAPISIGLEEFASGGYNQPAMVVALFDEKEKVHPLIGEGQNAMFIESNSVPRSLVGNQKPGADSLIAVVSCWDQFAALARVYLLAARVDPEALIIRSTNDADWRAGLDAASMIICDSFTGRHFDNDPRLRVFRLITDAFIERLGHNLM